MDMPIHLNVCGRWNIVSGRDCVLERGGQIKRFADRIPVSYTHLDVYKRQVERRAHEQGERLCWKFRSFVCKHGHAMLFEHAVEHASVLVLIAAENGDLPVAQTLFPYETADL